MPRVTISITISINMAHIIKLYMKRKVTLPLKVVEFRFQREVQERMLKAKNICKATQWEENKNNTQVF